MAVAQVLKVADKGFYYTLFDFPFILFLLEQGTLGVA
jgi:hypothetical protein